MCFDLDTGKVVTRRVIEETPYPDRLIMRANEWGKTKPGEIIQTVLKFVIVRISRLIGRTKNS